jgi:DNA-directed RNA polymerase subunit L
MELELIEKDKDSIKIKFIDPDITLINPLINELLEDEMVVDVDYWDGHPELDNPTLLVKVDKGKPQTALKRASKNLSNQYKEVREKLQKELK